MRLAVGGMTCGHCVRAVTEAVQRVDPGAQVVVDLKAGLVTVEGRAGPEVVVQSIADEGYTAAVAA